MPITLTPRASLNRIAFAYFVRQRALGRALAHHPERQRVPVLLGGLHVVELVVPDEIPGLLTEQPGLRTKAGLGGDQWNRYQGQPAVRRFREAAEPEAYLEDRAGLRRLLAGRIHDHLTKRDEGFVAVFESDVRQVPTEVNSTGDPELERAAEQYRWILNQRLAKVLQKAPDLWIVTVSRYLYRE